MSIRIIIFFPQYQKTVFSDMISVKTPIRISSIFGQNPWTNPFAWPLLKLQFFVQKSLFSFINIGKRSFLTLFLWKTAIRESSIFRRNQWTNPYKNVHFLALDKTSISWSENDCFLFKIFKNNIFWHNFGEK